ncbi:DUF6285 domain-containing protein [Azospirillum picis]|uniref:DUF6285 domain-containing protein n=1 Tax=Azospirillum picis TaxID=488438 RepID=A0ABU0MSJ0_9PROT|nr:DUF6285 domain-containing protein [Azospirillum picis]MBP2302584.1 hypothetical protein [Azospirillum picis]MDQ0536174.1 hypothetical protein [Azospirillum picis]
MRNTSDACGLLEIAAATFRTDVLAHVAPEARYAALMVANALAIVERELKGGDAAGRSMLAALAPFYGEDADDGLSGEDLRQRVEALQHRLCIEIAAGDFDHDGRDLLADSLEAMVQAQLGISNPKALG